MGLDQYIYVREKRNRVEELEQSIIISNLEQDDNRKPEDEDYEIAYFRKFNALQGYFERKYYEVAEDGVDVNCQNIQITEEDVKTLREACKYYLANEADTHGYYSVKHPELSPTEGFFYGSQQVHEYDIEQLIELLENIEEHLNSGDLVYYFCWY